MAHERSRTDNTLPRHQFISYIYDPVWNPGQNVAQLARMTSPISDILGLYCDGHQLIIGPCYCLLHKARCNSHHPPWPGATYMITGLDSFLVTYLVL